MKITSIKGQVKNSNRVSIYVDGGYDFSLSKNQLLEIGLRIGQDIDAAEIQDLKQASEFGKILERALNYVLIRPRSRREMDDYLRRKKVDDTTQQKIIDYLEKRRYLDDAAFAESWVRSRQVTKSVSKRRLVMELKQKGVSSEQLAVATSDHDDKKALADLVAKKRRQSRYQDDQKLMQYLARQGFDFDDIKAALATESQP